MMPAPAAATASSDEQVHGNVVARRSLLDVSWALVLRAGVWARGGSLGPLPSPLCFLERFYTTSSPRGLQFHAVQAWGIGAAGRTPVTTLAVVYRQCVCVVVDFIEPHVFAVLALVKPGTIVVCGETVPLGAE